MLRVFTTPMRSVWQSRSLRRMTQDEFFAWQEKQDKNYELVDGIPFLSLKMMTGASQAHDRVTVNIILSLGNQLRGGPCRPTTADLAVRIPAGNIRRPDVTIECGEAGRREMAVRDPRVVIEVLSPSTRTFDRFRKLIEYQSIESLAHILWSTPKRRASTWSPVSRTERGCCSPTRALRRSSNCRPSEHRSRSLTSMRD